MGKVTIDITANFRPLDNPYDAWRSQRDSNPCFSLERKPGAIFAKWLLATVPAEHYDFKTEKAFLYIPAITFKSA